MFFSRPVSGRSECPARRASPSLGPALWKSLSGSGRWRTGWPSCEELRLLDDFVKGLVFQKSEFFVIVLDENGHLHNLGHQSRCQYHTSSCLPYFPLLWRSSRLRADALPVCVYRAGVRPPPSSCSEKTVCQEILLYAAGVVFRLGHPVNPCIILVMQVGARRKVAVLGHL